MDNGNAKSYSSFGKLLIFGLQIIIEFEGIGSLLILLFK